MWIKGRGGYSRLLSIKVNPIFSPTGVDFSRGQSIEVIQRALINHNDDGRLRAVSLFFLVVGANRARNENDHARDGRPSFLVSLPPDARARIHSLTISEEKEKLLAVYAQGAHTICVCFRLLFYSTCTGFTVCFTYSDISLSMCINQC